jgi:hypothetical protein
LATAPKNGSQLSGDEDCSVRASPSELPEQTSTIGKEQIRSMLSIDVETPDECSQFPI